MTQEQIIALAAFALVTSITPGPNNLMLMASGANFGLRRSVPHMLGISLGFGLMTILVGIGLVRVFAAWPVSHAILRVASVAYLLYLALRIATAAPPPAMQDPAAAGRPFSFLQAAAFQWVNPKAWTMALTAITVHAPDGEVAAIALVGLVFCLVNLPSVGLWAVLGQQMRRILTNRRRLRLFNGAVALLLIASLYPVVLA